MQSEKQFLLELEKKWDELKSEAHSLSFRKGQILFYEKHLPYGLFLMLRGDLQFRHRGKACSEKHFWNFRNYKILCLESFLNKTPYACNSLVLSDADFLFLSKTEFLSEE